MRRAAYVRALLICFAVPSYGALTPDQFRADLQYCQPPSEVLYSGPAPGVDGLRQINARIPTDTAITSQVPLFISAEGLVSNGVTIYTTDP